MHSIGGFSGAVGGCARARLRGIESRPGLSGVEAGHRIRRARAGHSDRQERMVRPFRRVTAFHHERDQPARVRAFSGDRTAARLICRQDPAGGREAMDVDAPRRSKWRLSRFARPTCRRKRSKAWVRISPTRRRRSIAATCRASTNSTPDFIVRWLRVSTWCGSARCLILFARISNACAGPCCPSRGACEGTFIEHQAIYQAIAERRPDRAAHSMRAHLGSVLRELEDFVPRHPGFFEG